MNSFCVTLVEQTNYSRMLTGAHSDRFDSSHKGTHTCMLSSSINIASSLGVWYVCTLSLSRLNSPNLVMSG